MGIENPQPSRNPELSDRSSDGRSETMRRTDEAARELSSSKPEAEAAYKCALRDARTAMSVLANAYIKEGDAAEPLRRCHAAVTLLNATEGNAKKLGVQTRDLGQKYEAVLDEVKSFFEQFASGGMREYDAEKLNNLLLRMQQLGMPAARSRNRTQRQNTVRRTRGRQGRGGFVRAGPAPYNGEVAPLGSSPGKFVEGRWQNGQWSEGFYGRGVNPFQRGTSSWWDWDASGRAHARPVLRQQREGQSLIYKDTLLGYYDSLSEEAKTRIEEIQPRFRKVLEGSNAGGSAVMVDIWNKKIIPDLRARKLI